MSHLRVLFFVEGYTDIRFVTGLSQICELTMTVPQGAYVESGLKQRIADQGADLKVVEIPGDRIMFQFRSFLYLMRHARAFDVLLCQEVLRGALNGTLVGVIKDVPTVTYMAISPVEYFRCRRERGQIGSSKSVLGEAVIRLLMTINGRLATRCLAMGPYLKDVASRYSPRSEVGLYYGVDTEAFHPADKDERMKLRRQRDLPLDRFIIFLSSRVSHEKDPETVLLATALARKRGLDAVVVNLGGGYTDFLQLAHTLKLEKTNEWVIGRPAAHPMTEVADYFRCADVVTLASLAEGCGISPLEALACGTPAVCTAVGGMAVHLRGYARLTPKRDAEAMCQELLWVATNPDQARAQALLGREYVIREWEREKAFGDLAAVLEQVACARRRGFRRTGLDVETR